MSLYQRMLLRQILLVTGVVFGLVAGIVTAVEVLNQIHLIVLSTEPLENLVKLALFLAPERAVDVLPVAFVIALVICYQRVRADLEGAVFAAAGASPAWMFLPSGVCGMVLALCTLVVSNFVEPEANRRVVQTINSLQFDAMRLLERSDGIQRLQHGMFIDAEVNEGEIGRVVIVDRRDPQGETVIHAASGHVTNARPEQIVALTGGTVQIFDTATREFSEIHYDTFSASLSALFGTSHQRAYRVKTLATSEIWAALFDPTPTPHSVRALSSELVRRLSDWLYPLAAVCIVGLVFANISAVRRTDWDLLLALVLGCGVKALGLILQTNAPKNEIAMQAAFFLPLLPFAWLVVYLRLSAARRVGLARQDGADR